MTEYDFEEAKSEWLQVPVDDIDYMSALRLKLMLDDDLRQLVARMAMNRYGGWRNYQGRWRDVLGLDSTHGKTVLDYGCGVGLESLQFAEAGNKVIVADINVDTVQVAVRILELFGHSVGQALIRDRWPYVGLIDHSIDIFYSNGVLHHTPKAPEILKRAAQLIKPDGEVRLMLYSDQAWVLAGCGELPEGDVSKHPKFQMFIDGWDSVGTYAEPWWAEKLTAAVPDLELVKWTYLTENGAYAAAILKPRGDRA